MNAFLGPLMEASSDAITIVDTEGFVIYWNTSAADMYGVARTEIVGRKIGDFFQRESVMLFQVMESGNAVYAVYHEPRPDLHVIINTVPVFDEEKQLIGAISIERDVSKYVKLNAELYSKPAGNALPDALLLGKADDIERLKSMNRMGYSLLLTGESGTGKRAIAEWLHDESELEGNFVSFHCSSIPEGLLEAELFGFQGDEERLGKLDTAHGGSLYIKDVQVLPHPIQEKLARAMQEREYVRVGGTKPIALDCQLFASTVLSQAELELNSLLSAELYYAFQTHDVPSLRERQEDLPELCRQLLAQAAERASTPVPSLSADALTAITAFDWPGNLPQLRNAMDYAIALTHGKRNVNAGDLPAYARLTTLKELTEQELPLSAHSEEMERTLIAESLQRANGNKAKAARMLSISRGALYYKMKQYGLE
ncbi:sigma 54-interacting transcriptional regulator [Paenibacillus sp. 481]|nr:sigma 54-interacting transcriptional regulator [Paenibacillus sp. 481]